MIRLGGQGVLAQLSWALPPGRAWALPGRRAGLPGCSRGSLAGGPAPLDLHTRSV